MLYSIIFAGGYFLVAIKMKLCSIKLLFYERNNDRQTKKILSNSADNKLGDILRLNLATYVINVIEFNTSTHFSSNGSRNSIKVFVGSWVTLCEVVS